MTQNSSLRFAETVLEALDLPPDSIHLGVIDVRAWGEECVMHLSRRYKLRFLQ